MSLLDEYSSASTNERFGISRNALEWWSVYGFGVITPAPSVLDDGDLFLQRKVDLHGKPGGGDYYAVRWLLDKNPNRANSSGLRSLFTSIITGGKINLVPSGANLTKDQTYQNAMVFLTGLALEDVGNMQKRSRLLEDRVRLSLSGYTGGDYDEQRKVYDGALQRIEEEFSKSKDTTELKGIKLTRLQPLTAPTPPTPTPVPQTEVEKLEKRISELENNAGLLKNLLRNQRTSTNKKIADTQDALSQKLGKEMNPDIFRSMVDQMQKRGLFKPIREPK